MTNKEIIDSLRRTLDSWEERLSEDDFMEVDHRRGITKKPMKSDGSLDIEQNNTETIIAKINGGAREIIKDSEGNPIENREI